MAFVLVPLTFVESLPSSTAHYMVSKFTPLLFVGKVLHACPSMQRCLWKSLSMASVLVPLKIVSSSTSNTAQLHGIQFATANFCGKKSGVPFLQCKDVCENLIASVLVPLGLVEAPWGIYSATFRASFLTSYLTFSVGYGRILSYLSWIARGFGSMRVQAELELAIRFGSMRAQTEL